MLTVISARLCMHVLSNEVANQAYTHCDYGSVCFALDEAHGHGD